MPHLFYAELTVTMLTVAVCLALAMVADAPLKELANPLVPENPTKAPWYFLWLQELVSFSAFMGGIGIPAIVILGLALIPYRCCSSRLSIKVLRRPVDCAQYVSMRYTERLADAGIAPSVGSRGDSYDCEHDGAAARLGLTPVMTDLVSLR